MTGDRERWAEALLVHRLHGGRAAEHVSERMEALTRAGVGRWREIGERLDQLLRPGSMQ